MHPQQAKEVETLEKNASSGFKNGDIAINAGWAKAQKS